MLNIRKHNRESDHSMYHIIVNPEASSGQGKKNREKLTPILTAEHAAYELHEFASAKEMSDYVHTLTSKPDHAASSDSVTAERSGRTHLIVLGGDGTLNLVLNAIADFDAVTLSCIRVGSGNDFARNVGVPKDAKKALLHLLHTPQESVLDYGEAVYVTEDGRKGSRRFLISSGIGYDAEICVEANKSRAKKFLNAIRLGKLIYVAVGVKQIFARHKTKARIYMDDDTPIAVNDLFFVVQMIHRMEGGGVPFCPNADPRDGLLDICLAKRASIPKLLLEVVMVYFKKHLLFSNITGHRCKSLRIELEDAPQWIHTDGETPCRVKEAELSCKRGLHFVM